MQTVYWLGIITACLLGDASTEAPREADSALPAIMTGTSRSGAPGMRQVAAAHNRGAGVMTLLIEGGYGAASSFLVAGDRLQLQTQSVRVGYAPSSRWELFLGEVTRGTADSAYYSDSGSTWTQFQLQGAYHVDLPAHFFVGGSLMLNLPANTSGLGFAPSGLGGEAQGRASWRAHPRIEAGLNVGFLWDRSEHLLSTPASRMQRVALASAKGSRATWAVGVEGWLNPGAPVMVGGLFEASGQWAPQGVAKDMPIVGSVGVRLVPRVFPLAELSIGADLRMLGAPREGSFYAGVLPWLVFAQVAVHIKPFVVRDTPPCPPVEKHAQPTVGAPGAEAQDANARVVQVAQDANGVPAAGKPMVVSGSVLTPKGRPVAAAKVSLSAYPDVLFTTDATTGRFRTLPFICQGDSVKVTADTFTGLKAVHVVPCGEAYPEDIVLVPHHVPKGPGIVMINVTAKHWPASQAGEVDCRGVENSPFSVEPDKPLRIELPARAYHCTISAPGMVPQQRVIQVHAGDTTVLNIDLSPKAGHKHHAPRQQDAP